MTKKLAPVLALALVALVGYLRLAPHRSAASAPGPSSAPAALSVAGAFERQAHEVTVEDHGTVVKLLRDDEEGSRHQRFLVRVDDGPTVLIAHNLDLAPRVAPLHEGDALSFRGEYVWNPKGGVVHWTHRDPGGHHQPGWITVAGETFQ